MNILHPTTAVPCTAVVPSGPKTDSVLSENFVSTKHVTVVYECDQEKPPMLCDDLYEDLRRKKR